MTGPGFRVDVISNKYVNSPKSNVMSAAQKQLARGVLKENMQQCTGEHPCRSAISIATLLKSNFGKGVLL